MMTDTDSWPADLSGYGLLMLVGTGANGSGLMDTQVAQLTSWVNAGGTLLVATDVVALGLRPASVYLTSLLASMSIHMAIDDTNEFLQIYDLTLDSSDVLTKGAGPLSCGATPTLTINAPAKALDVLSTGQVEVLGSEALGNGQVVVLADVSCVSDYDYGTDTAATMQMIPLVRDMAGP
jgi:hypothetical protein